MSARKSGDTSGYVGEMYVIPDGKCWDYSQVDWKQLELLVAETVYDESAESRYNSDCYKDDSFLCYLIDKGEWETEYWEFSCLLQMHKSLSEVLAWRDQK